jgi:haloalkane dehalogenase
MNWKNFSQQVPSFPPGGIIKGATTTTLLQSVVDAYNAPFPDESYKAGARHFPNIVTITPDDPASKSNRPAWQVLRQFTKPFITAFSDSDPVTAGGDKLLQKLIPGCSGQKHVTIENGGHFLQEDQGQALAHVLNQFIQENPTS